MADPNYLRNWLLLPALPKSVLNKPKCGGKDHASQTSKLVIGKLNRWANRDFMTLWVEASKSVPNSRKIKSAPLSEDFICKQVLSYAQDGRYAKAAQTLASHGLATPSAKVFRSLQELHPSSPLPQIPNNSAQAPTGISEDRVRKAIRSFSEGTAPGPSSFRASFFRQAFECPSSAIASRTLTALPKVVNILAGGKAPQNLAPFLCSVNLFAAKRKTREPTGLLLSAKSSAVLLQNAWPSPMLRRQLLIFIPINWVWVPSPAARSSFM